MMIRTPRRAAACALAFMALCPWLAASAADVFPNRPITMVVPFPPGGAADIVARPVAVAMGKALGQTVIVENRPGAGGGLGMAHVAKARADGYTVLMALSSIVVLPQADRVLQRPLMFELSQLRPLARFSNDPVILVVRSESPWRNLKEFLEAARAKPGALTFGSSGNYGTMHIPVVQLQAETGTSMLHVPFTGASPALAALLGGQVDAVASGPATVSAYLKSGRLRALAETGDARLESLPDVPSLKEQNIPVTYSQWTGLFVPAGTPEAITVKLREAAKAAAADPVTVGALEKQGTLVQYQDAAEFKLFVDAESRQMTDVVRRIGKVE